MSQHARLDYDMNSDDFNFIRVRTAEVTGIELGEHKREMVYSRIVRRVRELGLQGFTEYCDLIKSDDSAELDQFVNAITTNLTSFFREADQFDTLQHIIFPHLREVKRRDHHLRLWSAGCSTGQEAYTIAMLIREQLGDLAHWDIKVLASDLDSAVLTKAKAGVYDRASLETVKPALRERYFRPLNDNHDKYRIDRCLHTYIRFNRLNLMGTWPMKRKFDVIFCRNVLIYFNQETQITLLRRFYEALNAGGYLLLGHSESLHGVANLFTVVSRNVFQKKAQP